MPGTLDLTVEIRDLTPQEGWRVVETTGQTRVTCPCGLDTGLIPTLDGVRIAQDHLKHGTTRTA